MTTPADDHPQAGQELPADTEIPAGQVLPTPEMVSTVKSTALNLAVLALEEDPATRKALVGAAVVGIVNAGPEYSLAVLANLVGRYGNTLIAHHGSVEAARDSVLCELSIEATDG